MKPNQRKILFIVAAGILILGGIIFITRRSHVSHLGTHKDVYYCPMHPQIQQDKPGSCPICYMKLVKKEEEASQKEDIKVNLKKAAKMPEGYASVNLTTAKQQIIGVKTAKVQREKIVKTIRAVGTVAHDPQLYQAQAEYIQAVEALKRAQRSAISEIAAQAQRLVDSTRIKLKHLGLNDELIDEMASQQSADHSLLIGHAGGKIWVYSPIYEYELPYVQVEDELSVEVPSLPGKIFKGKVRAIDPMVDAMTRTVRLRSQIEDADKVLKPDMYVNIEINIGLEDSLTVPPEAVFNTGTKQIVFIDKGDGVFEPREVMVGAKTATHYQVIKGLKEGEMVVVSGNFLIDSESRLKAAIEGLSGTTAEVEMETGTDKKGSPAATHAGHGGN